MKMSWVTADRICGDDRFSDEETRGLLERSNRPLRSHAENLSDAELLEKLRGFGLDLDRGSLENLCAGALSAEEVAGPLIASRGFRSPSEHMQGDWIWICVAALWQRWWPDKVCLELVDDKVQAGYREVEHDPMACPAAWLEAWSDVLRVCDATGVRSIEAFDDRFPMTQSLYNWSQDLEDALWNAGIGDREMLRARIAVCAEALRRFPAEDQLMMENRRKALAESYFELDEAGKGEELFESWLADDPRWGFGWIGWASCYLPHVGRPKDYGRAEQLLCRGYATPRVRDRDAIADWLQEVCEETGRQREAEEFARQAEELRRQPPMTVPRRLEPADEDEETSVVREPLILDFRGLGLPPGQPPAFTRAASANAAAGPARAVKVGRNAPCPCGSGTKYKKCCGSPLADR